MCVQCLDDLASMVRSFDRSPKPETQPFLPLESASPPRFKNLSPTASKSNALGSKFSAVGLVAYSARWPTKEGLRRLGCQG